MKLNTSRLLATIAVSGLITLFSCKKDNSAKDNTLTGKWKLTETYADPGNGKVNYIAVPKDNKEYISFNGDGTLDGSGFANGTTYVVKDSVTIAVTSKDNTVENYRYSIKNGTLQMSPAGPIVCIEGCGTRYRKMR